MKSLTYSTKQTFKYISIFSLLIFGVTSCSTTSPKTLGNHVEDDGIYYKAGKDDVYQAQQRRIDSLENALANQNKYTTPSGSNTAVGNLYFDEKGNGPEETYYDQEEQKITKVNGSNIVLDNNSNYESSFGANTGTEVNVNVWGGSSLGYGYNGWNMGYNSWGNWSFGFNYGWGGYPYYGYRSYYPRYYSPWHYYGYGPSYYPGYRPYYPRYYRRPMRYGSSLSNRTYNRYNSRNLASRNRVLNSNRSYNRGSSASNRSYRPTTSARNRSYRPTSGTNSRQYRNSGTRYQEYGGTNRQYRNGNSGSSTNRSYNGTSGNSNRQYKSGTSGSTNRSYNKTSGNSNRQYRSGTSSSTNRSSGNSNRQYRSNSSNNRSYRSTTPSRSYNSGSSRSSGGSSRSYRR